MKSKTAKRSLSILRNFIISLGTLMIVSKNTYFIPKFLNTIGINSNETIENAVISILITALIELSTLFFSWFFSKVIVDMSTHINGSERSELIFSPTNANEYETKDVEVKLAITTPSNFLTFLVKKLNLSLEIYFNPDILDISFKNEWDYESVNGYKMHGRTIKINLLENIITDGELYSQQPHEIYISTILLPIRIEKQTTNLDYTIAISKKNYIASYFARFLLDINSTSLIIKCEEGD